MPVNERTLMYEYIQKMKILNKTILSTKLYSNVVFWNIIRISLKNTIYPNNMCFN